MSTVNIDLKLPSDLSPFDADEILKAIANELPTTRAGDAREGAGWHPEQENDTLFEQITK